MSGEAYPEGLGKVSQAVSFWPHNHTPGLHAEEVYGGLVIPVRKSAQVKESLGPLTGKPNFYTRGVGKVTRVVSRCWHCRLMASAIE